MYGLIKTHKDNNPVRVLTSGCGTTIEYLSIFVEKYLQKEVNEIGSRIKDTPDMLNTTDLINDSNIFIEDSVLVSFDIVKMFPNIDNVSVQKLYLKFQKTGKQIFHQLNVFQRPLSYLWNATILYLMRSFISRKIDLLWDHICHVLIVILLCIGLT